MRRSGPGEAHDSGVCPQAPAKDDLGQPRLTEASSGWTILEPVKVARNLELAQMPSRACCYAMEAPVEAKSRLKCASTTHPTCVDLVKGG